MEFFGSYSNKKKLIGLLSGLLLGILCFVVNPMDLPVKANQVFAIAVLMIVWWIFESLPMPVVALLPLLLFPVLKVADLNDVAANYANPIVFLFMGGFFIALAIEKWNLHKRMALSIISITGANGNRIILGFIIATAVLSLWLSNTATTMMMFPIALSVIQMIRIHNTDEKGIHYFSLALMLSIAYASNFALGTIIATPPNVAYTGYMNERFGHSISFNNWMLLFMPLTFILLMTLYWILTRLLYPNRIRHNEEAAAGIERARTALGPMSVAEWRVLWVFCTTVLLWITKDPLNNAQDILLLDDTTIAIFGAILLFLIPSGKKELMNARLLAWPDARNMAWDVLLLFGGGIALADALESSQLVNEIGSGLAGFPSDNLFLIILCITAISVFLSEVISNLALVIILSPVVTAMALALKIDPLLLGIPMTLGASCASMLPMGTPPNAIVFAQGQIKMGDMMKTGFVLNIICILLISFFCRYFLPMILN